MHCPLNSGDGAEIIIGYVARTLDGPADSAFLRHLGICPGCREAVAAQEAVWSALDAWHPAPVSPDFDSKLFRRMAQEERVRSGQGFERRYRWWRPAMPVAAAGMLLAGVFLVKYAEPPRIAQEAQAQPKLEIEQVEHALDDMDLLRQLGVEAVSNKASPSQKI